MASASMAHHADMLLSAKGKKKIIDWKDGTVLCHVNEVYVVFFVNILNVESKIPV